MTELIRCGWATAPEMIEYHDNDWGVPEHDDVMLFELLTLEGAQAGLSWLTVLRKRQRYRHMFAEFDVRAVAGFDEVCIEACLADAGIIRNRAKVISTVNNARHILEIQNTHGSFDTYLWGFTCGKQIVSRRADHEALPASDELSITISKDLKKRGFNFVGPTIIYSYLQAVGIVDDHYATCFCSASTNRNRKLKCK